MMKIVLSGYMGSGKSKIGVLLSKKLGINFIDLDTYIENIEQKSISEIFKNKGEIYFRKVEHNAFKELLANSESFVLSTGGGTLCYAENHLLLQNTGVTSVLLKASVKTIINRIKGETENRPVLKNLKNEELEEFIHKHFFERSFYYNHCQFKINTDDKSPDEIVSEITSLL